MKNTVFRKHSVKFGQFCKKKNLGFSSKIVILRVGRREGTDTPTRGLIVWRVGGGGRRGCLEAGEEGGEEGCEGGDGRRERERTIEIIAYKLHPSRKENNLHLKDDSVSMTVSRFTSLIEDFVISSHQLFLLEVLVSPVRLLQGALVILVRLQTSQFFCLWGSEFLILCFLDATLYVIRK